MILKNVLNLLSTFACILITLSFNAPVAKSLDSHQIASLSIADSTVLDEDIPEELKYYKERYEVKYKESFELIWKAAKKSMNEIKCLLLQESESQNEQGFYQGILKSDYCVLAQGTDTSQEVMDRYSYDRPRIMAGVWRNCRVQYRFVIREQEDGSTVVLLKTEMSGFEEYVTVEVQFWKSNGILEHNMFLRLEKNIELVKKEK
jgi:hypothetical protein